MQDFELLSDSSGICNVRSIVDRSRRTQLSVTSDSRISLQSLAIMMMTIIPRQKISIFLKKAVGSIEVFNPLYFL